MKEHEEKQRKRNEAKRNNLKDVPKAISIYEENVECVRSADLVTPGILCTVPEKIATVFFV